MVPFIIFIGIVMTAIGIRGKSDEFFELVKGDFSGQGSFIPWIAALGFLYMLGFIPGFRPVSRGFMVLVLVTLFLKRGTGFFDQFNRQLGIT